MGPPAPPYRTFKVTRVVPGYVPEPGKQSPLEVVTVAAHTVKYGPMGILIFDEGIEVPGAEHLTERITRVFRSFEEVEEVSTPSASSLLIS
jgi:hypothetical protein